MVDGLARHCDLALARPLVVVVVLLERWHIVGAVVLVSQTLDSIGAAWPPAVSLSSCRADHALLVVAGSVPWILTQDGVDLPSTLLHHLEPPTPCGCSSCLNFSPLCCQLTIGSVRTKDYSRVATSFEPAKFLSPFVLFSLFLPSGSLSVDRSSSSLVLNQHLFPSF